MFALYLSLLSFPIAQLSFIWTFEIWGDQVKFSSRRTPRYFTELVGNNLFPSSFILKESFSFVFCLQNTEVLFFLHLERVYLVLATLRVFSDHNSLSLLMFPGKCQRVMFVSSAKCCALELEIIDVDEE